MLENFVEIYYNIIKTEKLTKIREVRIYYKGEKSMDLQAQQKQFDEIKWFDSILVGEDRCGTYEFCEKCNKYELYPCANAMRRHQAKYVRVAMIIRRKTKKGVL